MKLDPILAEVRRVREEYALQFKGDIDAMMADIRRRQEGSGRVYVSLPPKRVNNAPGK
jgi:hypothetical protein